MKKLESTWYNMLIVLTLIAVVAGAALGFVNQKTSPLISENDAKAEAAGVIEVLKAENVEVQRKDTVGNSIVYITNKGIAVKAEYANAFDGTLTLLVGFDYEGNILGYKVLKTNETPGLGAKADKWFQEGSKGNIVGMSPAKNNMTVSKDGGEVDAITASTITSRAFLRAVNTAYAAMNNSNEDVQSGASVRHHDMKGGEQ